MAALRHIAAVLLAALVATLAFLAAPAPAALMGFDGTRYTYTGQAGEVNDLRVLYDPNAATPEIQFDDRVEILDDGTLPAGCAYGENTSDVRCPFAANPRIDLGDENDKVQGDISDDGGSEEILGGAGNDILRGGKGDDLLDGGPGDDEFEEGSPEVRAGNDAIIGGDGFDTTFYSCTLGCNDPVTVRLDGVANDGPAGQSDNVQTERVDGGDNADLLVGGPGAEQLFGNAGVDEVRGGGGNDVVDGGVGADRVYGEDGDDDVRGGDSSDDLVDGGAGRDKIQADGLCFFIGCDTGGNDQIQARDGVQDTIDCGGGFDTAVVDSIDALHVNGGQCESVDSGGAGAPAGPAAPGPSGPGTGGPPGGPSAGSPAFTISAPTRVRYRALSRSGLRVTVRCERECSIDAGLFARAGAALVRVGRAPRTLADAGTTTVRVKLTRTGKRRLRRARRLTLTLRVKVTQGGESTTRSLKVGLRR